MVSRRVWERGLVAILAGAALVLPLRARAANDGDDFSEQQKIDFLTKARVIHNTHTKKGITEPYHLTLSDGMVTHDGKFQIIHEDEPKMAFADGTIEFNFKDYWEFNIAGYQLAKLLGLENMVPVTVERSWNGMSGALEWWVDNYAMDEADRTQKHIEAPDPDAWNKQMYKIRVLDELVYDMDANLTNVLITKDWKIWRIDFTRAFRTWKKLKNPENLVMCDKNLFEKLKALNENDLKNSTKKYLTGAQVKAVMARRDLIVDAFNKLIAQKGESAILY